MKLAACWRYESSFSKFIWPVLTDGVCFSWCSLKCHRDLPEFEVEFEIDDDIILPPKAVATFKLEFNWFLGKLEALQRLKYHQPLLLCEKIEPVEVNRVQHRPAHSLEVKQTWWPSFEPIIRLLTIVKLCLSFPLLLATLWNSWNCTEYSF